MKRLPHVLTLFLDGVGIGAQDPEKNPYFATQLNVLTNLVGGKLPYIGSARRGTRTMSLVPVNATLGVDGLPQSGTGQTSLMTGVNAARFIGKHFGPYPYSTLRPVIQDRNIFLRLHQAKRSVRYVNAFPKQFFDHVSATKTRMSAITMSWLMAGFELNDSNALLRGEGLSADITSERWNKLGFPHVRTLTPQEAGKRFAKIGREHNFTLFEYYYTDHVGHSQSMPEAIKVLQTLDGFIEGVLSAFDYENMLFLIISDHGNLEDLSTKSHTRNQVPLVAVGAHHRTVTGAIKNLSQFTPVILDLLK